MTGTVTTLDPAGSRVVDPDSDVSERSAQRSMSIAMARHAEKPGRDLHRVGWLAQFAAMDRRGLR